MPYDPTGAIDPATGMPRYSPVPSGSLSKTGDVYPGPVGQPGGPAGSVFAPADDSGSADAEAQARAEMRKKDAALDLAIKEETLKRISAQNAASAEDPETKAAKLEAAKLELEKTKIELERLKTGMTPQELAQFQADLAEARQLAQNDFNAAQDALKRQADAKENQAQRDFTAGQNDLSRGVTLRGQEIERLKAQDDWVMGMLRQQVAEGTLSLARATNMFDAYITRARLPSQIMESVSRAVEPFSASIPGKNYVAPGFEQGGAMDSLASAAGLDPSKTQRNPFKDLKSVDITKLAKKAGADFDHVKIPDPGKIFGDVKIPQTDFGQYQSALAGFAPAQYPGAPAPPMPGPAPQGPAASVVAPNPDYQMSDDQIAQLNALLDGAQ